MQGDGGALDIPEGIDVLWLAQNRFRRRRYQDCVEICNEGLSKTPHDEVRLSVGIGGKDDS